MDEVKVKVHTFFEVHTAAEDEGGKCIGGSLSRKEAVKLANGMGLFGGDAEIISKKSLEIDGSLWVPEILSEEERRGLTPDEIAVKKLDKIMKKRGL